MAAQSYGLISLVPAILAIALTLYSRQVLLSLFAGIWVGATVMVGYNPVAGAAKSLDLVVQSVIAPFDVRLLLFTFLIGAMLGMIFLSGGMNALARRITARVNTKRQAKVGTAVLGMLIFVDSYASTMITGSVMRPITDEFDVSREKLSYILDSTTSPTASVAVVSTWLGFEVGLIRKQVQAVGAHIDPFVLFLQSIPYRFYSLLAMFLVFVVVLSDWDFGPMEAAEKRARETGKVIRDDATPLIETQDEDVETPEHVEGRWWYFAAPVVALIVVTAFGLLFSGGFFAGGKSVVDALSNASTASAILWASFAGASTILAILVFHARVEMEDVSDAIFDGFKMVMFPVAVLSLAWTIGSVSQTLGVGPYIVGVTQGFVTPELLPAIVFVTAVAISFAIGTSWGTMAIIFPVAIPLAVNLGGPLPVAVGAILTGAIFGDHCSPISDTTVMSSMFAASDHVDHVNTQIPYAVLAGAASTVLFVLAGYGLAVWGALALGVVLVVLGAYSLSEHVDTSGITVYEN